MIYKYLAYFGIAAGLFIAGGFIGRHLGGLSAARKLAEYKTVQAKAVAKAEQAASTAQSQADQATIRQAQTIIAQANEAVQQQAAAAVALQDTVARLRSQMAANAKNPAVSEWLNTVIPPAAVNGLCFPPVQPCREP